MKTVITMTARTITVQRDRKKMTNLCSQGAIDQLLAFADFALARVPKPEIKPVRIPIRYHD